MKDALPTLVLKREFLNLEPTISVIIPCFNQEEIIFDVLMKVVESIKSPFELIIINDNSKDQTLERVCFFSSGDFKDSSLIRLEVYSNDNPRFETYCDHFGFSIAKGKYLLEIQADMFINDRGFDIRMIQVFNKYQDIFALSGRGTHSIGEVAEVYLGSLGTDRVIAPNLHVYIFEILRKRILGKISHSFNPKRSLGEPKAQIESTTRLESFKNLQEIFPTLEHFEANKRAGLLGNFIENSGLDESILPSKIFLGETVMRGPLMLRAETYFRLGGLNVNSFYQGFDDHELMLQAWSLEKKRCAYMPMVVTSILSQGTTRKPRNLKSELEIFFNTMKILATRKGSLLYKLSQGDQILLPNFEIRDI
jgi:hypothetical protein